MKVFFVWLFIMSDGFGQHIVTAFKDQATCESNAAELNAKAGPHRGLHWFCQKQAVEK